MSDQHGPHSPMPFLESTFEDRPITARWGPSVVHAGADTHCATWAMLVAKGHTPAKTFVWFDGRAATLYQGAIASVQTNRDGVFVGRHPSGVPVVLIENWTYLDDTSGVT